MPEMLEVHLINAVAPGILCGQLHRLMTQSPFEARYIVNVSALEGQFAVDKRTGIHPHTNMAKAALNMLTRSIAGDYARDGIYVHSVDPGWVSDQIPRPDEAARQQFESTLPLDMEDAAARICDPILSNARPYGVLWKDYRVVAW